MQRRGDLVVDGVFEEAEVELVSVEALGDLGEDAQGFVLVIAAGVGYAVDDGGDAVAAALDAQVGALFIGLQILAGQALGSFLSPERSDRGRG